jgi:RNA polymerase sigma-70 factor, ECF subfamily
MRPFRTREESAVAARSELAVNEQDRQDLFSQLISRHHSQLYAYIFAVVKNQQDAEDLFQSVCLVLWRRFESFQPNTSFFAWARQTAKFVLCSFFRHKKNLPAHVGEELLDALAGTIATSQGDEVEVHLAALRRCREKLNAADIELLDLRYGENLSTVDIAERLERFRQNVSRSLNRIRRWLVECVQIELARQAHPGRNANE